VEWPCAGARKAGAPGKEGGKVSDAISKAAEQLLHDQQLEEDVRQARLQRAQEEYDDLALVSRLVASYLLLVGETCAPASSGMLLSAGTRKRGCTSKKISIDTVVLVTWP
jgi:hypothetical protein